MFARTSVGGLLLEEVEGWTFAVHDGVIAGKCGTDPGLLRIATFASNKLPNPITHEACLARAAELVGVANPRPSEWRTSLSVTGPYGSVSFERGPDRIYAWYCSRSPGLIVGAYSCPADSADTFPSRGIRIQCNCMITTAVFDRRVWGADEPVTRVLTDLLGPDADQTPPPPTKADDAE